MRNTYKRIFQLCNIILARPITLIYCYFILFLQKTFPDYDVFIQTKSQVNLYFLYVFLRFYFKISSFIKRTSKFTAFIFKKSMLLKIIILSYNFLK